MSEMFSSIRTDLTDRRLLPVVALVGALLVAAIAYAVLGGGSGSAPAPHAQTSIGPTNAGGGLSVSSSAPEQAVAETTDGFKEQKSGKSRNPFSPLPGTESSAHATATSSAAPSTSTSSTGTSSTSGSSSAATSSGGSGSSTSGGSTSPSPEKPSEKKKSSAPGTVYDVAIEFGVIPAGTTPENAQLTPYSKLKLQTPLPTAQQPLIVFRGVTAKGKSATFSLVGEAILTGTGACLPSASQCEAVDIKPGETEQLGYLAPDGQTTVYELRVLGITAEKKTAKTARAGWAASKAGEQVLHLRGIVTLPFLRYSKQPGVLVFAPRKASAARARIAVVPLIG